MVYRDSKKHLHPARFYPWTGLVLLLLFLNAGPAASQSTPLAWESFWQRIEETKTWLSGDPPAVEWIEQAKRWSQVSSVRTPEGETVVVDTSRLVAMLSRQSPDPASLRSYLDSLLQARQEWDRTGGGSQELANLSSILSRPQFQWPEEQVNPISEFLKKLWRAFLRLLDRIFPAGQGPGLSIPSWLVILLSVSLLAAVLAYILRGMWKSVVQEVDITQENALDRDIFTAQQALQRAQQLSAGGDLRQAVRFQYLAALLLLDERGVLKYNRSLTNREVLRQVMGYPALTAHLRPVIDTFDRVWYGFQPLDGAEYTRYASQIAGLAEINE